MSTTVLKICATQNTCVPPITYNSLSYSVVYNKMCNALHCKMAIFYPIASYLNCVLHSNINRRGVISMTLWQSKISTKPSCSLGSSLISNPLCQPLPSHQKINRRDIWSIMAIFWLHKYDMSSHIVAIYHGDDICYICQSIYLNILSEHKCTSIFYNMLYQKRIAELIQYFHPLFFKFHIQ